MDVEIVTPLYLTLQRYAGWLDRGRTSAAVRADVAALGAALGNGGEISAPLDALDASIGHVPSGAVRKMLQATVAEMRRALQHPPLQSA